MRLKTLAAIGTGALLSLSPQIALAQTPFPGAPDNVLGWCTVTGSAGSLECFSSPMEACIAQHQGYAPNQQFLGYVETEFGWDDKLCQWPTGIGITSPTLAQFRCESPVNHRAVAPGNCVHSREVEIEIADNNGASPDPNTCSPIDILSGAKRFQHTDFALASGSLALNRHYFSRGYVTDLDVLRVPTMLASDWVFDFQYELQLSTIWNSQPRFSLITPSGGVFEYVLQSDGSADLSIRNDLPVSSFEIELTSTIPANLDDVDNATSTWTITDQDDTVWTVETIDDGSGRFSLGRVTGATMRGGETLSFTYGANNELTAMADGFGSQVTFSWVTVDPNTISGISGEPVRYVAIDSATLPDGTTLNYEYDTEVLTAGVEQPIRLTSVERRDGAAIVDSTTYHFEDSRFPNAITGVTGHDGIRYWTVAYDSSGRATQSTGPNGADETLVSYAGNQSNTPSRTVTNALGKEAIYRYQRSSVLQSDYRLTTIEGLPSPNCVASTGSFAYDPGTDFLSSTTDEEGFVTAFTRDGLGRPTQIVEASGTPAARTTDLTYNSTFNQLASVVSDGLSQSMTYDALGNLATLTLTDTTTHTVPYSTNGQSRTWTYSWSAQGRLQSIDGPLAGTADTVSYTYDANGFLATTTNALGHITTITAVNGRGQPTSITDENGIVSTLSYDPVGRIETVTVDPGPNASVTTFTYNALGLITRVTEPNGAYLDYTYDSARRVTAITNNLNDEIRYTYDDLGGITLEERGVVGSAADFTRTQTFDELGRLLTRVGAGARTWTYAYDRINQLTDITDPRANTVTYGYDGLRRIVSHNDEDAHTTNFDFNNQDALTSQTDPRSIVTSFVRNGFGEAIRETSPDIGIIDYVRDSRGLITQRTDARGTIINYTYDADGRMLTESAPSDPGLNIVYSYDSIAGGNEGIGRVTSITDASGSHAYTYDAQGRLTQEVRAIGTAAPAAIAYSYDGSGNIEQMIYPSGRVVTYTLDATGAIERVLTQTNGTAPVEIIADFIDYEPFGPLQAIFYGNDLSLWQTFDSDYRLDQLLLEDLITPAVVHQRFHAYTDDLNLTEIFDTANLSGGDQSYWYTGNRRLQNASGDWGDLTIFHDSVGNRTFRILDDGATITTDRFWYGAGDNRLDEVERNGVLTRLFTHDAAGHIIDETRSGVAYAFTHDARGRMATVTQAGLLRATHTYDAFERLAARTLTNLPTTGTVHYIHDQRGRVIAETDGSGQTLREYIWIDDRPIAAVADVATAPVVYNVHTDHLNRPIAMSDSARTIVWRANYLPFGEVSSITGPASLDMRFPGQWFQLEAGFHHNWHRTYDPTTGRYLQPDPLGMPDGPSRWAYARSAPTMFVDPTGEYVWVLPTITGALSGIGIGYVFDQDGCYTILEATRDGLIGAVTGIVGAAGYAGRVGREWGFRTRSGSEWRFAPFGNQTTNRLGQWPHYHRSRPDITRPGESLPGQGRGRHRPWQSSPTDQTFGDRF